MIFQPHFTHHFNNKLWCQPVLLGGYHQQTGTLVWRLILALVSKNQLDWYDMRQAARQVWLARYEYLPNRDLR